MFKDELRSARIESKLTHKMLSEKYDIPIRTIEAWEEGIRTPPVYVQRFLLDILNNKKR